MGRRPLVVPQNRNRPRLVALAVLVVGTASPRLTSPTAAEPEASARVDEIYPRRRFRLRGVCHVESVLAGAWSAHQISLQALQCFRSRLHGFYRPGLDAAPAFHERRDLH